MITAILSDFSRVILFPKDTDYFGALNTLHSQLQQEHDGYIFTDYFQFNTELLDLYQTIKNKIDLYLLTESRGIMKIPEVKAQMDAVFKRVFTSADTGLSKADPRSYMDIAKRIQKPIEEILFIDDRDANLIAAQKAGLPTVHYISNTELFQELRTKYHIL